MAEYAFNQEGVQNFEKLAMNLRHFNANIEQAGSDLRQRVADVSDELGIFEDVIIELIGEVNTEQEKGREAMNYLAQRIDQQANEMALMINIKL